MLEKECLHFIHIHKTGRNRWNMHSYACCTGVCLPLKWNAGFGGLKNTFTSSVGWPGLKGSGPSVETFRTFDEARLPSGGQVKSQVAGYHFVDLVDDLIAPICI